VERKIVLFLSSLRSDASPKEYSCPDGSRTCGLQTNEAPVKYLLQKYSDISEILCIVTPEAKETAWEVFDKAVRACKPGVILTEIPYEEPENFNERPLAAILARVSPGQEILLETTGGLRNTIMQLLLLNRILSYRGVRIGEAVYSNFQKGMVEDVSHLFHLFDLVGGMQELTSFGSVRTLRTYYGTPADSPVMEELLASMERLNEVITLCRASQIDDSMKRFSAALQAVERQSSDPLMAQLLPVFRQKFGEKMSVLDLIEWCVENDMLQQALTLYTEMVPSVIMRYIKVPKEGRHMTRVDKKKEYEKEESVVFVKGFLKQACYAESEENSPVKALRDFINTRTNDLFAYVYENKNCDLRDNIRQGARNLKSVILAAYPEKNGKYHQDWAARIPPETDFLTKMNDQNWGSSLNKAYGMLQKGMNDMNLCLLLESSAYAITLDHLEKMLTESGYIVRCPISTIEAISRDYLYIKTLRNMTNHANSEETTDQELLMRYLSRYGYKPLAEVMTADLKQAIMQGLVRLRKLISEEEKK